MSRRGGIHMAVEAEVPGTYITADGAPANATTKGGFIARPSPF